MKNVAILFSIVLIAGCATVPYQPYAREVKRQPQQGGIIALKTDNRPEDRTHAESIMRQNCGSNTLKILEEGEVITGQTTTSDAKKTNETENQGGLKLGAFTFGGAAENAEKTQTTATTTALKEWQISYTCVAATTTPTTTAKKKKSTK